MVSPGPAAHFTLVSGAGQSGTAAETLATPLAVSLHDDAGRPVPGVAVAWSSSEPGGRFVPATVLTDRDGMARTRWVLGSGSGVQVAEAGAEGWDGHLAVSAEVRPGLKAVSLMRGSAGWRERDLCWGETVSGALAGSGPFYPAEHTAFHQIVASGISYAALTASGHVLAWGSTPVDDGADLPGVVLLPHPGPWADLSVSPGAVAILARDSTVHARTRFDDPGQPGLPLPVPQPLP